MNNHRDQLLTGTVRDALDACLQIDGLAVQCQAHDGVVVLFGQLANCIERERAAQLTARSTGVLTVRNELTIRVSGADGSASDEVLAARVRVCIAQTELDGTGVVVDVNDHLVTLSGRTTSVADRAIVRHAVGSLSGVVRVENDIAIGHGARVSAGSWSGSSRQRLNPLSARRSRRP